MVGNKESSKTMTNENKKQDATKTEMVKAVESTMMFLEVLFAETTDKEKESHELFCNSPKQRRMLHTGY